MGDGKGDSPPGTSLLVRIQGRIGNRKPLPVTILLVSPVVVGRQGFEP